MTELNPFKHIDENNLDALRRCYVDIFILDYAIVSDAEPEIIEWLCTQFRPTRHSLDLCIAYSVRNLPLILSYVKPSDKNIEFALYTESEKVCKAFIESMDLSEWDTCEE